MKKFLAVYLGSAEAFERSEWSKTPDEARRKQLEQAGMHAWSAWVGAHRSSIVDPGTPLGKTKRIDAHGVSDSSNRLTAYTVIEAESHEAAASLFERHPHFTIFPGDSVEVMECLPLPGSPL
ncbi:hypothetical protein [Lysobacter antibioticus]|uniref:hypothetical protein n=1 Tax=Lysobacter antibioticus TaxID=84531 RepID=UPI000A8382AB|nr:hypothetical protein [Lysobacter antibioticus]